MRRKSEKEENRPKKTEGKTADRFSLRYGHPLNSSIVCVWVFKCVSLCMYVCVCVYVCAMETICEAPPTKKEKRNIKSGPVINGRVCDANKKKASGPNCVQFWIWFGGDFYPQRYSNGNNNKQQKIKEERAKYNKKNKK